MWTKENIPNQSGKTVIVTGANAGIGFETALALYQAGAHVVLACRDLDKAQQALEKIQQHGGNGSLGVVELNLSNLAAIKQFADEFKQKHSSLDILINNAGVMLPPAGKTDDGYELQFGVNFLGHYALTGHLYELLKATPQARVVTVSSMAYLHGSIDFDNLRIENSYDAMREYCQSKLGNILFTLELQRKIETAGHNVLSIAAQPGANKTELTRHMSQADYDIAVERVGELMDAWQGALPSLRAAVDADAKAGELYSPDKDGGYRGYPEAVAIAPHALDEALAQKLWLWAEEESGVRFI